MPNSIKKTNVIDKVIEVLANIGNIAKKHETTNCDMYHYSLWLYTPIIVKELLPYTKQGSCLYFMPPANNNVRPTPILSNPQCLSLFLFFFSNPPFTSRRPS